MSSKDVEGRLPLQCRTSLLDIHHPDARHAPVAGTTVFTTPDDGRRKRPKHVE